ncbi:hypothetical protein [Halonotius terrestris]|uniref:hypothetical protein n=1 Tax=Halonotius terrestris TaxID=2487750 RepID=UPI00163BECD6|nr:hypothetical protein [Halonotius terrestris]
MHETDEIDPIVPELPTRNPITDGGTQIRRPPERPPRTECTPEDEGREAISPLVPDLR